MSSASSGWWMRRRIVGVAVLVMFLSGVRVHAERLDGGGMAVSAAHGGQELSSSTMSAEEVQKILPHRYPFLLVDRVLDLVPGERGIGIKQLSMNEEFLQGHFPGRPIMPGVLQVEALAQLAGIVANGPPATNSSSTSGSNTPSLYVFAGVDGVKWRRPVVPGDTLVLEVQVLTKSKNRFSCSGKGFVGGRLVVEVAKMSFATIPARN